MSRMFQILSLTAIVFQLSTPVFSRNATFPLVEHDDLIVRVKHHEKAIKLIDELKKYGFHVRCCADLTEEMKAHGYTLKKLNSKKHLAAFSAILGAESALRIDSWEKQRGSDAVGAGWWNVVTTELVFLEPATGKSIYHLRLSEPVETVVAEVKRVFFRDPVSDSTREQ